MPKQLKNIISLSPVRRYSEAFKRQVVAEFERRGVTKDFLQKKYGILGKSRVLVWCRKFGKLDHSGIDTGKHGRPLMDPVQPRIKEQAAALKRETAQRKEAELKVVACEKLIEIEERDHSVKLKKDGAKPLAS